jgi:hypothetical protein
MLFWAIWVAVMFGAALNAKALGASIVAAIALLGVYPNEAMASGILLMYVAALVVAAFRD